MMNRRTSMLRRALMATPVALAACCAGCSSSDLPLAEVSGVLQRGEEPLSGVLINSFPESGPIAVGITDSSGEFVLRTGEHDGALVGNHVIVITPPSEPAPMPGIGERNIGPVLDDKFGIPRELQIRDQSPLKYTLEAGDDRELVIDVSAQSLQDSE